MMLLLGDMQDKQTAMGVDIIQNCEVTGFDVVGGKINGVRTSRGDIKVKKDWTMCCWKYKYFSRKIKHDICL